jgi:threonine dehydrogenase-like Zn-dependent dehydrogenase
MPKELICIAKETLEWREYDEPKLAPDQVRVQSEFSAAKHGTEMAFYKGYALPRGGWDEATKTFDFKPAANPLGRGFGVGNMAVGPVVEVGPAVKGLAVGDRVLVYGNFRQTHVRKESDCWKIPASLSWKSAVCLDPCDFALGAVRDGHVRVGDAVAVLGMGAIGMMVVQLCKVAGACPVIASEPIASRRDLARRIGADIVLDSRGCDVGMEIKKATAGRGADVIIDYSGSAEAMRDALRGVAYGGKVVAGAFPPPYPAGLDFGAESHMNNPTIVFTRACSEPQRDYPRWNERRIFDTILRLLIDRRISGEQVVSPVVAFEDLAEVYPRIPHEPETLIKLGCEH